MSDKKQKPTDENPRIQDEKDKLIALLNAENEKLSAENEKLAAENAALLVEVERLRAELTGERWVDLSPHESIRASELRRLALGSQRPPEVNPEDQNNMHQWSLPSLVVNGIEVPRPWWGYAELLARLRSGEPLDQPKEPGCYQPAGANPNPPGDL